MARLIDADALHRKVKMETNPYGKPTIDVMEKLVELIESARCCGSNTSEEIADHLISNGVTVNEWINSEEMLPEFPCLAIDVNGNSVFIPDGILTIKDKHGEWCINASLAKEVRLIDGTKMDALIWENRIAYWMPLPKPTKGE